MPNKIPHLDSRTKHILHTLIKCYLEKGNAVGSRTLSTLPGINCSPATIRNVMADLEDIGFLTSPHTSAGRIPSASGIRFFVDQLLTINPLPAKTIERLEVELKGNTALEVMDTSIELMANLTAYAGFIAIPSRGAATIKTVRFIRLSSSRILAVLVTTDGDVLNRIFTYENELDEERLNAAAVAYNHYFSGLTLNDAKVKLHSQLVELRHKISSLLQALLDKVGEDENLNLNHDTQLKVAGEFNLLKQADLSSDIKKLTRLFDLLGSKKDLLKLINYGQNVDNVQIFIGNESGFKALDDCSVIFSPFHDTNDKSLGVIGIVGPKRMRYSQVIPTVSISAKMLGKILEDLK